MAIPNEDSAPSPALRSRQRFIQRLDLILHKLDGVAKRRRMPPDEREEFISWALLRMVESDYAVVREWRGDARFRNYLNVVVSRLLLDFRNHKWGKFRVSLTARRAGRAAELLDILIHRDGFSREEAVELVLRNHGTDVDRERLFELAEALPHRQNRKACRLGDAPLPSVPSNAEEGIRRQERRTLGFEIQRELEEALGVLQTEDLCILRLRFCRDRTADEIGADLDLDRRRVYQRIETILNRLQRHLYGRGFERAEMLDLVGAEGVEMRFRLLDPGQLDAA